jgi:hypothetical protein
MLTVNFSRETKTMKHKPHYRIYSRSDLALAIFGDPKHCRWDLSYTSFRLFEVTYYCFRMKYKIKDSIPTLTDLNL